MNTYKHQLQIYHVFYKRVKTLSTRVKYKLCRMQINNTKVSELTCHSEFYQNVHTLGICIVESVYIKHFKFVIKKYLRIMK